MQRTSVPAVSSAAIEDYREELRKAAAPIHEEIGELKKQLRELDINFNKVSDSNERNPVVKIDPVNVFVKNIPSSFDDNRLEKEFAPFGEVASTRVMRHRKTDLSLGFGFVRFKDQECAQRAILSMNGAVLEGYTISCKLAQASSKIQDSIVVPSNNLYVKPLRKDVTEEDLTNFFNAYGRVLSSKIIRDSAGDSLESGLVRFETVAEADAVLSKVAGCVTSLHNCPLIIRYAETPYQKQQRRNKSDSKVQNIDSTMAKKALLSESGPLLDREYRGNMPYFVGVPAMPQQRRHGYGVRVSNLPARADDYLLYELFASCFRDVITARVITDRQTGESLGYGFVTFQNEDTPAKAVEFLNNRECEGNILNVTVAQ